VRKPEIVRQRIGRGGILGTLAGLLAALAVPSLALATGGSYVIAHCDTSVNPYHTGARSYKDTNFQTPGNCTDPSADYAMVIFNQSGGVQGGRHGTWTWTAPPGEAIVGVTLAASLRNDNGFHARVYVANGSGVPTHIFGQGDAGGGWASYSWSGVAQPQLVAELFCATSGCAASSIAHVRVKNIRIHVADYGDPMLQNVSGALVAGGWLRGTDGVTAEGIDGQSGMLATFAVVNGMSVALQWGSCQTVANGTLATQFDPCSSPLTVNGQVDTTAPPFHDGHNDVKVCAADYARNTTCQTSTARVDNTPPVVAFANVQDPRDPELIKAPASDATSGLAGGTIYFRAAGSGAAFQPLETTVADGALQARVNSTAVPAGQYEFMAVARDAAGNDAATTTRQDGTSMVLTFPLKAATRIQGHLQPGASKRVRLRYGRNAGVAGRLKRANGKALRKRKVVITENFAPGSIVAHRRFKVKTNKHGRFHAKLPPGPSRGVEVGFPGNHRYSGSGANAGRLLIGSKATFSTSKDRVLEGKRVDFHSRVLHFGARIPPAGKLVELQVKQGAHKWNTVEQAIHTNSAGVYHLHYRFGTFYNSNVRYRFRVKIDHEADWPYKAPVRSRARSVTVIARH
jgi:hypothetical protein